MGKIIDNEFLQLIKTLTIRIQLSLKSGNLGSKRSTAKGASVEFSDYREYVPGDDFRRIDWNAMARFEKVFIKLFMQEQECPVTIFVDQSESMKFDYKRETAVKIGAVFAYTALSDYDTVSLVTFNEKIQTSLLGLRGGGAFNKVIHTLENIEFSGNTELYNTVKAWQPRFRKGITVLASDFMYDSRFEEVMKMLAFKKQRVVICHILSEKEINPTFEENVRIIDSENNEYIDLDTGSEAIEIYQHALEKYIAEFKKICSKYGADYLLINAETPIEHFIKKIHSIG